MDHVSQASKTLVFYCWCDCGCCNLAMRNVSGPPIGWSKSQVWKEFGLAFEIFQEKWHVHIRQHLILNCLTSLIVREYLLWYLVGCLKEYSLRTFLQTDSTWNAVLCRVPSIAAPPFKGFTSRPFNLPPSPECDAIHDYGEQSTTEYCFLPFLL